MIPNPILKVLSSMAAHQVHCLLMGGQACVFYGAAEFSRDSDFAILAEEGNLTRLRLALKELQAEVIAVPPFDVEFLTRGHAVHFRCRHPECAGLRVDVMSVMRGVDPFPALWERRTSLELADGTVCHLLSVPDLVLAKQTQRDKDWPMIRRLLEADYFAWRHRREQEPRPEFWLKALRTSALLLEVAETFAGAAARVARARPLLRLAIAGDEAGLQVALELEEQEIRKLDRDYWLPLKKELEALRRERGRQGAAD